VARLAGTNEYKWIHPFTLCRFLFVEHGPATVESSPVHYLLLIIPVTLLILGLGLIRYKGIAQRHPYLDWLGAGYVLLAIPLSLQSFMGNHLLSNLAALFAFFYLAGFYCVARGVGVRYGGSLPVWWVLPIFCVVLALMVFYSVIRDDLAWRLLILNVAIALILSLSSRHVVAPGGRFDRLDSLIRGSYMVLVGYAWVRAGMVLFFMQSLPVENFTRSGYWVFILGIGMLVALWFALLMLFTVSTEVVREMKSELDRDPLTGLLNRRAFFELARIRLQQSVHGLWVLIVCDLDHFKKVNDTWGHAVGDRTLQTVSQVLREHLRGDDLAARFGGEEFLGLFHCAELTDAKLRVDHIRRQIGAAQFTPDGAGVTASFGAVCVFSSEDLGMAIECADALLYEAKRSGRNQVKWHHETMVGFTGRRALL